MIVVAVAAFAGACTPSGLPKLPPVEPLAASGKPPAAGVSAEIVVMVPGTPTGVYSQVARGALNCWFGADGPLKVSHVFEAEAEPPATGGAAEIVVRERDATLRDQRGPRAYRVSFASDAMGVRVGAQALKFAPDAAKAMARDVEVWAKGGAGCQLRAIMPPPVPTPVAGKGGTGKKSKKR